MAALPESDVAAASSAYPFTCTFGQIWGIALASIVFNSEFNRYSDHIGDLNVRSQLSNGATYAYASEQFIPHLLEATRSEVIGVYVESSTDGMARRRWAFLLGFCVGFSRK
jgi:hypothetical protein